MQVPGVVRYPNLTSQATPVSGINVTSFLIQDFALDLTSAERRLLSNYSYTYPKVVVRGQPASLLTVCVHCMDVAGTAYWCSSL